VQLFGDGPRNASLVGQAENHRRLLCVSHRTPAIVIPKASDEDAWRISAISVSSKFCPGCGTSR
jgi:hypothetical protein